ncbi:MAG TPA: hypothetical protein VHZ28_17270 [Terracidiphilus sp.]|jgi:hypothetical protein|nr:hypothetical protein [Terracidiphilus sp.]
MKRRACLWILILATTQCWCAPRKITVAQLEEMLHSMQRDKRQDAEIATALKQIELSQELTRKSMNSLVSYAPGPLATEQIYVLEAKSANLVPPDADLPATPAPNQAEQKAILDKTSTYVTGTYAELPKLEALKTTLRFQDNVEALAASSGLQGGARDVTVDAGFSNPANFVHYINSAQTQVISNHGAEKLSPAKEKTQWGANKMVAIEDPDPNLTTVFRAAESAQEIQWLRWQLINGKVTAVFSFDVPRKQSHFDVHVCCFPKVHQSGIANFYTSTTAQTLNAGGGGAGGGVNGNFQTNTNWHDFKTTVPFHGQFYIDPQTGTVLRMLVQAELNPAELVHQLDTRIDFAPMKVRDKVYILPVKTFVDSLVVPNGDSGAATYSTRRTLFTSEYKDYEPNSN